MALRVAHRFPTWHPVLSDMVYTIEETPLGNMIWQFKCEGDPHIGPVCIRRQGRELLDCTRVTDEDAEDVTGLDAPAAVDRLRELVHAAS